MFNTPTAVVVCKSLPMLTIMPGWLYQPSYIKYKVSQETLNAERNTDIGKKGFFQMLLKIVTRAISDVSPDDSQSSSCKIIRQTKHVKYAQ